MERRRIKRKREGGGETVKDNGRESRILNDKLKKLEIKRASVVWSLWGCVSDSSPLSIKTSE